VIYALITALVLFIYFSSEYVLKEAIGYSSIVSTVFTALVTAIIYTPLLEKLQAFTDAVFFREKYNSHRILSDTSRKVSSILRLDDIVKMVSLTFLETMKISEVSFLMKDSERHKFRTISVNLGGCQSYYKRIETSENNPIIKWLKAKEKILVRDEMTEVHEDIGDRPHDEIDALDAELEKLEFALWVPIFLDEDLAAVICLGYKISGDMYTDEDLELLEMLSHQLAVALENSIMYSTINRQYEELKTTKDKLVQADKLASLGNMAAGMAHEIKNPLSSMKVFSQLIGDRYDDPEFRRKFMDVIPKEINRIDRIVEGLISFAKSPEPQLEKHDIAAMIDAVLADFKEEMERNSVKVAKEYVLLPMVLADKDQLMRAFANIILNAIQAVGTGGEIKISLATGTVTYEIVQIRVSDNGAGISKENMKHLFDPFFTTKHYGTGLGLAITHSIIEGHKGSIDITSESGQGTTVTVTLPVNMRMI
jgi:two-component system NtrC family sensor kinase